MITADVDAVLFSVKSFAAAMVAYYVTLSIGFSQPVWAVTTVYLISQPLAGAVLSKALYRLLGTILGAAAAVIFLPAFVNEPLCLSLVLALWLGFCVYVAQRDTSPRSYAFLLAGYTASMIGFPSVLAPGTIFNTAILRVQEIAIAIVAVGLIHGMILPRTVTKRLQQLITTTVKSAEHWSRLALRGGRDESLNLERRRLATSVNDIDQLSYHVPFDTARFLPRVAVIRALLDQLSWLLGLGGALEDRIAEYVIHAGSLSAEIAELLDRAGTWLVESVAGPARDKIAQELIEEAERLERVIDSQARWGRLEMLSASLFARLIELIRS